MSQDELKKAAAENALRFVKEKDVVGIGTGSTVNFFIDALAQSRIPIDGVVVSSKASMQRLMQYGFEILDPNSVVHFPIYVDGADEVNSRLQMIK
ncbi:MAG: ribose-5-phosphate isomerase A, partial [Gammaproteobacteria bacterium]|nr:ribose-5-phosphate isomerase A [Gammaproteobacteria bacterium]